ncbi:MAG: hypothetical protein Q8867_04120 [Bacteroidota bacterium]|nr:hypothetical protein [Bacteroidota bacterium]
MKSIFKIGLILALFLGTFIPGITQPVLVLEKIGTRSRFIYSPGNLIKIRLHKPDTVMHGYLLAVQDSSMILSLLSSKRYEHARSKTSEDVKFFSNINEVTIPYKNIDFFYHRSGVLRNFSSKFGIAAIMYFTIISLDHVFNHQAVFTKDVFIVSGSCAGISAISFTFTQHRYKVGTHWKIKVMDFHSW